MAKARNTRENQEAKRREQIESKFSNHDKELMDIFAKRSSKYDINEKIHKRYKIILFGFIAILSLAIFNLLQNISLNSISAISVGISGFIMSLIGIQRPPYENKEKNDVWGERRGKILLIARLVTISCVVFSFIIGLFESESSEVKNGTQIILGFFFANFFYGLFTFVNLYVIRKPEKLLSPIITGLGTGFYILSIISSLIGFLYMNSLFMWVIISYIQIRVIYLYISSPNGVNPVQTATLGIISPKVLYDTFDYHYNKQEYRESDKKREQKLKEKHGDAYYRVHTEQMLEREVSKNKTIRYIGGTVLLGIFSIVMFIISSATGGVIEGIAQDLFSKDIKDFCCNKLGLKKLCK